MCGAWVAEKSYVLEQLVVFATELVRLARRHELVDWPDVSIGSVLIEAADDDTSDARVANLAEHPATFVTALVVARRKLPEPVQLALTRAPVFALSCAWELAKRATQPAVLAHLAQTNELNLRWYVAQNPHTALATLEKLAYERWSPTLQSIARHPNADAALLRRLARDRDEGVLEALANNPRWSTRFTTIRTAPMPFVLQKQRATHTDRVRVDIIVGCASPAYSR